MSPSRRGAALIGGPSRPVCTFIGAPCSSTSLASSSPSLSSASTLLSTSSSPLCAPDSFAFLSDTALARLRAALPTTPLDGPSRALESPASVSLARAPPARVARVARDAGLMIHRIRRRAAGPARVVVVHTPFPLPWDTAWHRTERRGMPSIAARAGVRGARWEIVASRMTFRVHFAVLLTRKSFDRCGACPNVPLLLELKLQHARHIPDAAPACRESSRVTTTHGVTAKATHERSPGVNSMNKRKLVRNIARPRQ